VRLLDPPAEVLDLGRHIERLGRHVGGKGVPFQAIQGEQSLVRWGSFGSVSLVSGRYAGGRPVAA
jgi:hypothetical protein